MSEIGTLYLEKRDVVNSRTSKKLRKQGYVPASISRRGKESISVALKADELRKSLAKYGRYALFNFSIDKNDSITGLVKDIQESPIKGEMLHVDLQEVSLSEEIRADLPIRLKGIESLEFKKLMALPQIDEIRVKGLPQDIPDEIVIDLSNIDRADNINVSDIEFPKGIVSELSPDQMVVSIVEIKKQNVAEDEGVEATAE